MAYLNTLMVSLQGSVSPCSRTEESGYRRQQSRCEEGNQPLRGVVVHELGQCGDFTGSDFRWVATWCGSPRAAAYTYRPLSRIQNRFAIGLRVRSHAQLSRRVDRLLGGLVGTYLIAVSGNFGFLAPQGIAGGDRAHS